MKSALSLSRGALDHTNETPTWSLLESRGWTFIVTPVRPRFLDAGPGPAVGMVMLNSRHFQLCVWTTWLQQLKSYALNHRKPLETKKAEVVGGGTWVEVSGHYRG